MQSSIPTIPAGSNAPTAPKCLQAFYGARDARPSVEILVREPAALPLVFGDPRGEAVREEKRKATARALIAPGDRPQEIYTPPTLLRSIRNVWPVIALDPCSGPQSLVGADASYYVSPSIVRTASGRAKTLYIPGLEGEADGLTQRWTDYTYCNPPFGRLKDWIMKARHEGEDGLEVMLLTPARTNRKWFRDCAATATKICELDPVTFVGYKSSFPAPLWMLYWGQLHALFTFEFQDVHGDVR